MKLATLCSKHVSAVASVAGALAGFFYVVSSDFLVDLRMEGINTRDLDFVESLCN